MKKFLAAALIIPHSALASVLISEIAWMGSMASPADEWIELTNTGTLPLDLSGWRIVADDGSPDIRLSKDIPPGGYFLIERTNDESVPSIPADLVASFGKGMSNAGETLRLKDASGTDVDVVVGGADWKNIGGDVKTKETAQRLPDERWITASATPKAPTAPPTPTFPSPVLVTQKTISDSKGSNTHSNSTTTSSYKIATTTDGNDGTQGAIILWSGATDVRQQDQATKERSWLLAGLGILLTGAAGIILLNSHAAEPTEADEYEIIEDIIEGND